MKGKDIQNGKTQCFCYRYFRRVNLSLKGLCRPSLADVRWMIPSGGDTTQVGEFSSRQVQRVQIDTFWCVTSYCFAKNKRFHRWERTSGNCQTSWMSRKKISCFGGGQWTVDPQGLPHLSVTTISSFSPSPIIVYSPDTPCISMYAIYGASGSSNRETR